MLITRDEDPGGNSLSYPLRVDPGCDECDFSLWEPIVQSNHSKLGLYNDARFPGRCILAMHQHYSSIEDVPMDTMLGFLRDIQVCMQAIRAVSGASRVNVAVLGNRVAHVHAHLVPRFPEAEEFPDCSPWNDRREKTRLTPRGAAQLKSSIFEELARLDQRRRQFDSGQTHPIANTDPLTLF